MPRAPFARIFFHGRKCTFCISVSTISTRTHFSIRSARSDAARAKFAGRVDQTVKIRFARRSIISRRRSFSGLLVIGFVAIDADVGRGALAVARPLRRRTRHRRSSNPPHFTMGTSLARFWRRALARAPVRARAARSRMRIVDASTIGVVCRVDRHGISLATRSRRAPLSSRGLTSTPLDLDSRDARRSRYLRHRRHRGTFRGHPHRGDPAQPLRGFERG